MKTSITIAVLSLLLASGARAGLITITLDNPDQTGNPGQTLNFFGTITNTDTNPGDAPIFLNADFFNFTLTDATVTDNFVANVPISLAEGASSGDIDLFDITLANPEAEPFGLYAGAYGLSGGMDGGAGTANDPLAEVDFSVDVEPVSSVPEPASLGLFSLGLALIGPLRRRRDA